MKTQSRALKIIVVLTIGLISIIAFHAFAKKPDTLSGAPIKRQWAQAKRLKNPDPAAFKKLLGANEAIYCLTVRKDAADQGTQLDNGGWATMSSSSVGCATRGGIRFDGGLDECPEAGR